MSKRNIELKPRGWRKPRESGELTPEKLFSILASVDGEKRAIEKMIDLGCDVSQWVKTEGEDKTE